VIVDLFAGPGGWDEGLNLLGNAAHVEGIEWDQAACETARAAGHARTKADIAKAEPREYRGAFGVIGSPPCPGFSPAGLGLGRKDLELLTSAIEMIGTGFDVDTILDNVRAQQHDERSALTLEPLRWALSIEAEWVALEQVPAGLPLWKAYANLLRSRDFSVWTGLVQAERYGVPQTRKRAVLIASRARIVAEPVATHSRYHTRNPSKLDEGVQKWVSMAEALGRGAGRWVVAAGVTGAGTPRPEDCPAPTMTGKGTAYWINNLEAYGTPIWTPTPAIEGENGADITWPYDRPSPTIVGSFAPDVVAAPGYRKPGDPPRQKTPGSVRVTVQEAAVLQSFRHDYPWAGKQGKQFQQVGNAVPPLMAAHVLAAAGAGELRSDTAEAVAS
jgi:DNA (cytosine-5)-methyltransferase 1